MALSVSISDDLVAFSDKCIFPQSVLSHALELHNPLPHPLIFRLSTSDKAVLVGVKEFTAPEGTVKVPKEVFNQIGSTVVEYNVAELPRATFLQVKPTQFYPHITNWKYYLESFLSKNYTTLSKKQTFGVYDPVAKVQVTLQVEDANDTLVVVVDTDIALDVVPLNDIMAAQQLSHDKNVAYLENVPSFDTSFDVELQPLSVMLVPAIHKIDLRKLEKNVTIKLVADDLYNVDLLGGLDKFLSLESFNWCTMDQDGQNKYIEIDLASDLVTNYMQKHVDDECWLYIVPFAWEHACKVKVIIDNGMKSTGESAQLQSNNGISASGESSIPNSDSEYTCTNCGKTLEKSKAALHEAFCYRHNVRCSCGEVFQKPIPSTHWHCDVCHVHGNSSLFKFKHNKLFHQGPYVCDQCDNTTQYPNYIELVKCHRGTECAAKLHECIFCHLVVPQEKADYEDKFANLSHHENQCGNKTTECYECGRVVKTKDLASHMRIHYLNKVESAAEAVVRCTNENCTVIVPQASNDLGLCESCFGPLYAQVNDPTYIKLQNRLERKYVMQLTKGCGNTWCENRECAVQKKWGIGPAIQHIHQDLLPEIKVPVLPINKNKAIDRTSVGGDKTNGYHDVGGSGNRLWLCLDASGAARTKVYDKIMREGQYSASMVLKAVAARDEIGARSWLQTHAVC